MDFISPAVIKSIAEKYDFQFKKGLGQNFLTSQEVLEEIAAAHGVSMDVVMYAFVLRHPAKIMVITGTMDTARLKNAVSALDLDLTYDEWYAILAASRGFDVP